VRAAMAKRGAVRLRSPSSVLKHEIRARRSPAATPAALPAANSATADHAGHHFPLDRDALVPRRVAWSSVLRHHHKGQPRRRRGAPPARQDRIGRNDDLGIGIAPWQRQAAESAWSLAGGTSATPPAALRPWRASVMQRACAWASAEPTSWSVAVGVMVGDLAAGAP